MTWIPCSVCGGMCLGKCAGLGNAPVIELPNSLGCSNCKHIADANRALDSLLRAAVIERDAARRALTERHALAASERETELARRVEELTKERDEAIAAKNAWRDQASRHEQFDPRAMSERAVSAESRVDELRRVIAELVRK